jgi:hypothetical protein
MGTASNLPYFAKYFSLQIFLPFTKYYPLHFRKSPALNVGERSKNNGLRVLGKILAAERA